MPVLDPTQFNQLVNEVREALEAGSQGVGEIEVVTSLANLVSLPALRLIGATETVVEAPIELLSAPAVEAAVDAREALLQLRELQKQVAQAIIEAYESLDQMKLTTDQSLLATSLLNQALAKVDELQKEVELTIVESKAQVEQGKLITVRLEALEVDLLHSQSGADNAAARALVGEQRALDAVKLVGDTIVGLRPDWAMADSTKSGYIFSKPEVPTLEAIPAVDTLTYINIDGKEIAYKIGDYVRVANIENDLGYTFYQLYNLTEEGSAVWGETGSGSGDLRETVRITLASNQAQPDNALIGATIQVTGTDGTEYFTGTWQGAEIKVKVTALKEYNITVGDIEGYATPAVTTYTSEIQGERSVTFNYNPILYSYITINQNITDPATMISGDINGAAIQAIRQNSHRVIGKYTGPKQMTYCRLMDDDGTKYHDGTTYTPQIGADVFMMLPEFYTKATETSTDVWKIGFAFGGQPDETWKKWGGNDLIGAYKAYYSGKLYSRTQVTPTVSVNQANFKTYARNRGDGYTLVKHKHQNIMAFLFYAMYGNTNAQAICGAGTSSYPKQTGQTNPLGMEDTVNGGNGSSGSINFWGLENWWGDIYEWEDNVAVDNRVWKVTEDDGTVRTCPQSPTSNGYITKIQVNEHLDTICKAKGGSGTTGYCDYYYQYSGARVVARSYYSAGTDGGVAFAYASSDASGAVSHIGSRLAFMGDLVEAESVAAFAAIPVTNA